MQSLALDVKVLTENGEEINLKDLIDDGDTDVPHVNPHEEEPKTKDYEEIDFAVEDDVDEEDEEDEDIFNKLFGTDDDDTVAMEEEAGEDDFGALFADDDFADDEE